MSVSVSVCRLSVRSTTAAYFEDVRESNQAKALRIKFLSLVRTVLLALATDRVDKVLKR
jgi:hypothetical protein